jgi:hypothetical protein
MEAYKIEKCGLKVGVSGDLTAGVESARIDMSKGDRLSFLVRVESAATDLSVTLRQHDAATAGNSKDLQTKRLYGVKADADSIVTKKEQASLSANIVEADLNGSAGLLVVEVLGEDLDRDADFRYVSLQIGARAADGCVICVMDQMRQRPAHQIEL